MSFYFSRHSESEANRLGLFAGQDNPPLTDLGRRQALRAGRLLRRSGGVVLGTIFASPLDRVRETALIIAGTTEHETEIVLDERLMERNLGSLAGTPKADFEQNCHLLDDAESVGSLVDRTLDFMWEYADTPGDSLIVSSAGVWRVLEASRLQIPRDELVRHLYDIPPCPNAEIVPLDTSWLENASSPA
ncbi:MAG TPA: histidine phosphatase family protein [Candidatus Saccharimonadales bacterium]